MEMFVSAVSFAFTVGTAVAVHHFSGGRVDATLFIAGSALWWGIRAYYSSTKGA